MAKDYSKITFDNVIWRFLEKAGNQIVSFGVTLILARLLSPESYGSIALVVVILNILNVFINSGLGNALVQKKDVDEEDYSTVFSFNLVFCMVIYLILYLIAPYIARFYNDDIYVGLLRVAGINILISGIKNIQQAYVAKKLIYKKFFLSTLGGTIISAIISIVLALYGFGVWALVTQTIVNNMVDTIILWITVDFRPKFYFSVQRFKTLFSYGWKVLTTAFVDALYNNIRKLIIGKLYTTSDLALYNKGAQFPELFINNVVASVDEVLFPVMSSVQNNLERVRNMTSRAIKTSIYITAPVMLGMAMISEKMVRLLLTEKWIGCVPFLRIFCITYVFYSMHTSNLNAIKALGRSDIFLKLEIIKKTIGLVILVISMQFSVMVMAYSLLVFEILAQLINTWPSKSLLNYGYLDQINDILPILGITLGMCLGVFCVGLLPFNWILVMVLQIAVGGIVYIAESILFKIDSFEYVLRIIKSYKI